MAKLFEAQIAVSKQFEADTEGKTVIHPHYYYWHDGQIIRSEGEPHHSAPGYKFKCEMKKGKPYCTVFE